MDDESGSDEEREITALTASLIALESEIDAAKARTDSIKRQLLAMNNILTASAFSPREVNRGRWSYARQTTWFEYTVPQYTEDDFKQQFRVSRSTFRSIVDSLRPLLERQETGIRDCIAVEKVVGIGLYKLCSTAEDRSVAHIFGVGRSTVNGIYREFCEAVIAVLEPDWLRMMTPDEMAQHIREFEAICNFPQGVGALDGCHFPISPEVENATDYYNYKGWHSIILLALVDHKYRFRFISVGAPGRCHDSHVYQLSELSKIVAGPLFQTPQATICGTQVPPLILCDQAFPLTPNLMKPFGHKGVVSEEERAFNYNLSRARRIVENAFGRLKARFRFTMKRMECDVENARLVIRACCILNNICEDFNDTIHHQWLTEVQQFDAAFPQPSRMTQAQVGGAAAVRSALVGYYRQRN